MFHLTVLVNIAQPFKYQDSVSTYAKIYGLSARTIERYKSKGKANADFLPLDDAKELLAWLRRYYPRKTLPKELLKLVQAPEPLALEQVETSEKKESAPQLTLAQYDKKLSGLKIGSAETLKALQEAEALAREEMREAFRGDNSDLIDARTIKHQKAADALSDFEKKMTATMRASGDLLNKETVKQKLVKVLEIVSNQFDPSLSRLFYDCNLELTPAVREKWEAIMRDNYENAYKTFSEHAD